MKINKQKTNLLTSGEAEQSLNFGIGDTGVIIDILRRRLYSHPLRTMIQEYICNGRDATRESGSSKNMIVVFPTRLDPVFKVRDFGPGLSPERVRDVFVLYGASTKRTDNTQTGGFGIGAKSAWAYTDSFTITSFFNGTKSTYIAHLGKNSEGSLDLLDEEETTEDNGVEIAVSIQEKDIEAAIQSIYRSCYFWDQKPVFRGIVDVELPEYFKNPSPLKGSNFFVGNEKMPFLIPTDQKKGKTTLRSKRSNSQNFWAVVDGIPYEVSKAVNERLRDQLSSSYQFYLLFNTGELQINANREEIVFDAHAEKLIRARVNELIEELLKTGKEKLQGCKELMDVFEVTKKKNLLFSTVLQNFSMDLEIKGSTLNVTRSGGDFSFCVLADQIHDIEHKSRIREWNVHSLKLLLPLTEDLNLPLWREFIRRTVYMKKMEFLKDMVLLRSTNPEFYKPLLVEQVNVNALRKLYKDFLENKKTEAEAKEKAAKERQEKKEEKEAIARKWGVEVTADLSYGQLRQYKKKITDKPYPSKWVYHALETAIPENLSSKGDLKKKIHLANAKRLRVLLTDPARLEEVKKLGLKTLDETVKATDLKLDAESRQKVRGHFQASAIPTFLKHFSFDFLQKIEPYCTESEAKTMKELKALLEHSPFVDLNSYKLLFADEVNEILQETKKEQAHLKEWISKYSFFTCLNYNNKHWQKEALKVLAGLNGVKFQEEPEKKKKK